MHQPNTNTQPTKHCNCHETLHRPPSNTYFLLPLDTASFYRQVPPIFSYGQNPPLLHQYPFHDILHKKCKPMTSDLCAPTKDLPVQFYTKGMKDRLIKMIYHPPPHRILLKFPMHSHRPHIFWLTIFCHPSHYPALLSLCTPCYHAKSQVKNHHPRGTC